jgi:hypothetical protein
MTEEFAVKGQPRPKSKIAADFPRRRFEAVGVLNKSLKTLPKTPLPGVLCPQWVRCGKRGCRCAAGQLHGPYHYRLWREGGRLRKSYVRPSDLEQVRERCEARRQVRRELQAAWQAFRQLIADIRELERQA